MLTEAVRWAIAHTWDGAPARADEVAAVSLSPLPEGALLVEVDAPFYGDAPPLSPPGQTARLWEHEVVEVFILGEGDHYTEVELGPHGHWLALRLRGYRAAYAHPALVVYSAHIDAGRGRWRGRAVVAAADLPAAPWRGNAYAIHGQGTARCFLAAHPVPGPQPDFHRLGCFAPLPSRHPSSAP
jgi:hypothetical protein